MGSRLQGYTPQQHFQGPALETAIKPYDWQIKLETAKPFTNANIQDNAWQFDFSASDPSKKKTPIYGEALYIISGKNYYYFMVSSVSYNWQPNQKVWQQVVDSLKTDQ